MDEKNMRCCGCGAPISRDEAAITRRLVNRGTTRYYCKVCLAGAFGVTTQDIDRRILYYKQTGCTLFCSP